MDNAGRLHYRLPLQRFQAGFGLGAVVWAPVAVAFIAHFGLAWALRVLGALFFAIIAICSRLITTAPAGYLPKGYTAPAPDTAGGVQGVDKDWRRMFATPTFWLLAAMFLIGTTSGMMVIGHASPIAQRVLGISPAAAGTVVSYVALGMVAGKLGWGALSDRIGRASVLVAMLLVATTGLVMLWQTAAYVPVVLGMAFTGLCYGGVLALMAPVTADAFGSRHLGINFGIMFLAVALAAFVGPRLAAAISEANGGDYGWAFVVAALITAAGVVLAATYGLLGVLRKRRIEAASGAGTLSR